MLDDSWNRFSSTPSRGILILGGKKITSSNESTVSLDLLDVQRPKKKKWKRGRCAAVFVETDRLSCGCDKREKQEKDKWRITHPRACWHCLRYACYLLNNSVECVTSVVRMKISSDESRDEESPKEFPREKVRRSFIISRL